MSQSGSLDGEVALITGASAGIGRASARALARDGADVALAARREERLESLAAELAAEFDVSAVPVPTDVTDYEEVVTMVKRTEAELGGLDVAIANAGVFTPAGITDLPLDEYRRMMAVNVDGMYFTARAALPHLREREGTMIFVGSAAGQHPRPQYPVYAATNWWVRGFALSMAGLVGEESVAVSVINPTQVRTELGGEHGQSTSEVYEEGEVSEPEDVAKAVVFAAERRPPNMVSELGFYRRDAIADMS